VAGIFDDLQLALDLADMAHVLATDRFRAGDLRISTKPDRTPVTDADQAIEQALRAALKDGRPDDGVLGEEYGGEPQPGRQWIIDPIDGTTNFLRGLPIWATLIALALSIALGIPAATRAALESGRKDPGFVVIDEVAGQLVALIAVRPDWPHALLALLLFRFFDILKPPPIRRLEALPTGTGIVVDDLGAGIYALIVLQLITHVLRH